MTTFKKLSALILALSLVVCALFAFSSCDLIDKITGKQPDQACQCEDANKDHNCDKCGTALSQCADENSDHNCDVCGKELSIHADEDKNHKCEICGIAVSECEDADSNHLCDFCGATASECADADNDHYCDVCLDELSACNVDNNKDHKCDICGYKFSDCLDNDKDHVCNHCGGNVGEHADADPATDGHNCNYCGANLCADGDDEGHDCDVCGAELCVDEDANCECDTCGANLCVDIAPIDHYCDVCGKLFSDCADGEDGNHDCDVCYKSLCSDGEDEGCACDVCGASLCVDADNNHACDNCAALLCYDSNDRGHVCDVCAKNLCADGEDEDHNCDVCGESVCYDTNDDFVCEGCGAKLTIVSVYAEGANCLVNGQPVYRVFYGEEIGSVTPSYYASEYIIDFWYVYDANNNPVVIIENGASFTPVANGSYYIVPVFVANNLGGVTDSEVDINMSDAFETGQKDNEGTKLPWDHEVIEDQYVLGAGWADVNLDQKVRIPVAGNLGSVGAYKAGSMQIMAEPGNAANAVLLWATSCNTSTGGFGNAIATFGIDADSKGDNYVVEFDYYLDHTYSNSDPGLEFFVTDGTTKYFIGRINQAKQFAGHKNGATNVPLENAATLISRNVDNNKTGCLSVKIFSDTWYTIRLVIENNQVLLSYSLRGTDEWTLLDTQDFSKVELSAKELTAFGFQAGYYNNNSIIMLDNIYFGLGHECVDADNNHNCDVCETPLCYDGIDADHNCDRCDANLCSEGDIADHYCDCGAQLSECADEDKTHYCDICGKGGFGGECADGEDEGHDCDYCGKNLCADEVKDHKCDVCGATLSVCADADKNHNCDWCGATLSECADENKDHACDICKVEMGVHADAEADGDHVCDYGCGATLSEHTDAEPDFVCDECAVALCNDSDKNHVCDITTEHDCVWVVSEHVDADKNHDCDFEGCAEVMGEHADAADDADHVCDYGCGAVLSECADADNHLCDVCNKILSYCADSNADHKCDVCGKEGVCTDADKNTICDNCGKVVAYNFETDSMVDNDFIDIMHSQSNKGKPGSAADTNGISNTITTQGVDSAYKYGVHYSFKADPEDAANQVLHVYCQSVSGGGANIPAAILMTPTTVDEGGALLVLQADVYVESATNAKNALHLTAVKDSTYVLAQGTAPSTGYQRVSIYKTSTEGTNSDGEKAYNMTVGGVKNLNVYTGEWVRYLYILDTVDNKFYVYYSLDNGATYTAVKEAAAPSNTSRIGNFADVTRMGIENDTYNTSSQSYVDNMSCVRINSIDITLADGTKTID